MQEKAILKMSVGCGRGCSRNTEKNGSTFSEMRNAMPVFKDEFSKTKTIKMSFILHFILIKKVSVSILFWFVFSQEDIIVFSRIS